MSNYLALTPFQVVALRRLTEAKRRRQENKRVALPLDTRDDLTPMQRVLSRSVQRVK